MNILIVSATEFEIAPFTKSLQFDSEINENTRYYKYKNSFIDILVTGIGIPFTTYHLTSHLLKNSYDIIINAGIAGSFRESIPLGSVTNVINDRFADIGIEDKGVFSSIFEINLHDKNKYPFKNELLINNSTFSLNVYNNLLRVTAVTVNKVSGKNETIKFMKDNYNPDIETMEGAAFAYVCLMEKIPFMQIRSISNFVEERDTDKWVIRIAVENLNNKLQEIIDSIV